MSTLNIIHARVDIIEDTFQTFMDWFSKYEKKFERYIVSEEIAKLSGKRHIHCYIETNCKVHALRMNFKKSNTQRDSEYSFAKAKDPMRTLAYVSKDGKILRRKNISDKDIDEITEKIKVLNKKTNNKLVDKMFLYVQENIGERIDRYEIGELILNYCARESVTISKWLMYSIYNVIHWKLRKRASPNFDKKQFIDDAFGFSI